MDMPIRIMVTLFVALVVGSTIIIFSKQMIDDARRDLNENRPGLIDKEIDDEQKIINLNTIDNSALIDLMEECYNRHHVETFEKELCFAVMCKDPAPSWQWLNIKDYFDNSPDFYGNVSISPDVADGDYALSIYFDPYGASETILISK